MLQGGDEREADRLVRDGNLGRVAFGRERGFRDRLDPGHLRQRVQVRCDRLARRPEVHRPGAAVAGAQHVQADIRRDPVEPRSQRRAAFEAVEISPRADERLLDRVFGLERRPEHPVAVGGQLAAVLLELLLGCAMLDGER